MLSVIMSYLGLLLNNFQSTKLIVGNSEHLETNGVFYKSDLNYHFSNN